MNQLPDDQLSKAAIKANLETLRYLTAQQTKISATIDTLTDMLRRAGALTTNGSNGASAPVEAMDAEARTVKVARIVKQARKRLAARRQARKLPVIDRRGIWRERLLQTLREATAPLSGREIAEAVGIADPGHSSTLHKMLKDALKDKAIIVRGTRAQRGGAVKLYALHGGVRKTTTATKPKKRGQARATHFQRQRSLGILNTFNAETPSRWGGKTGSISKLIANGYLRRTKDGYLRTDKVFQVTP